MSPGTWSHPDWLLPLAALWTGLALALAHAGLRARRRGSSLLGNQLTTPGGTRRRDLLLVAAFGAIIVAVLGPHVGERSVQVRADGVDVVVLLDVSRSMQAADVPPDRLQRARRSASGLLERLLPGDRAALAAFAGEGVLLTPLTRDKQALREILPALDTNLVTDGSTHLARGIRAAADAFDPESPRPRVVVVLSDGEDRPQLRAGSLGELPVSEVRVVAGAFGTESGSTIPQQGGPLLDARGQRVISRRQLEGLRRLAESSGGGLLLADAWGDLDLERTVALVRRDAGTAPGEWMERRIRVSRAPLLAALALALLCLELWPRRGFQPGSTARWLAALVLLGFAATGVGAQGAREQSAWIPRGRELLPPDPRGLIELGLIRARSAAPEEAARAFFAAAAFARNPDLAALAHYDLGVVALGQGDFERARDAFFDALALDPDDEQARFNLEWTLQAMQAQPPSPDEEQAAQSQAPQERPASPGAGEPGRQRDATDPTPATPGVPSDEPVAASPPVHPVSLEEAKRWLEQLEDDPTPALREAGRRAEEAGAGETDAPGW